MSIEAFHACIVQASAAPRVAWACSYVLLGLHIGSYVPGLSSESFCPVLMAASIFLFDTFLPTEEFDFGTF